MNMATSFMGLTLPTVSVTIGPAWASQVNAALTTIDSHDHSAGQGNQIPSAGLAIDGSIAFNEFGLTSLGSIGYHNNAGLLTAVNTMYVKDGDLYSNDGAGNQIRMTSGGAVNVGSVGGIGGDYGTTSATAFYTDASLTYFFQDSASAPAKFDIGILGCTDVTATGNTLLSGTLGVTGVTTVGTLAATTISTGALASTLTGYGLVKPGMIIAVASNLTGSHTIPSTGTVDSSGYMLCDGAVIPGSQTVSGTTPDLSDNRFLMGATSSGTAAGANTINLQHSHTVDSHSHSAGSLAAAFSFTSGGLYAASATGTSFTASRYSNPAGNVSSSASKSGTDVNGTTGTSTPGTDNQLSTAQSILPQYVTCQFLIRVK
jgi:hypothetical protein